MRAWFGFVAVSLCGVLLVGCPKPETTVSDANGNQVSVSGDGTKTTFTDSTGKTTTTETGKNGVSTTVKDEKGESKLEAGKGVSEADLGLPFYPGSTEIVSGSFKADTPDQRTALSMRSTTDDCAKVIEFYKPKLKEAATMGMGDAAADRQMVTGKLDSGAQVSITATREKGKTETEVSVGVSLKLKK